MFGIGPMELMAILVVALLVFGPKRIPELARTMGRGLAEFRRASNDLRQSLALDELERDLRQDPTQNQTIHRPDPSSEDRPAQAGADVADRNESVDAKHPGELPLGEEHDREHHAAGDRADDIDDTDNADNAEDAEDGAPAKQTNYAADSGLGNVPVSPKKPAEPPRG